MKMLRLALLALFLPLALLQGAVHVVSSPAAFNSAGAAAQPGDVVQLPAGTLSDWGELLVTASGSSEAPITISGPSVYATTLGGSSRIRVTGAHVRVEGLKFVNTTHAYPVFLDGARDCVVTRCYFSQTSASSYVRSTGSASDDQAGARNVVTHSYFTATSTNAVVLVGPASATHVGQGLVAYNVFRDSPYRSTGDGEAIVLYSDGLHQGYGLNATVAFNVFDKWDADSDGEIVGFKSGQNVFYRNVVAHSRGYLSLRRENGNWIEGNVFFRNTQGVRVYGDGHVILNNLFDECGSFGLYISQGWVSGTVEARAATNGLIAHNTFRNVGGRNWVFYTVSGAVANPIGNRLVNNIVDTTVSTDVLVRDQYNFVGLNTVADNVYHTANASYGPLGSNAHIGSALLTKAGDEVFLSAGSPAINRASALSEADVDFYGRSRAGLLPDAGHHEFEAGVAVASPALPAVPEDRASVGSLPLAARLVRFPADDVLAVGQVVNLDAGYSHGAPVSYAWDFGDGVAYSGTEPFITHRWASDGVYEITLTVSDGTASSTLTQTVTVGEPTPPPPPGPVLLARYNGGPATGDWLADSAIVSGTDIKIASTTSPIDRSLVANPAPEAVYQTHRHGKSFAYTLSGLEPGVVQTVRLHFCETWATGANQRRFHVEINGTRVLTNFDVFQVTGARFRAHAETFSASADANGTIVVSFLVGTKNRPMVSGVELWR